MIDWNKTLSETGYDKSYFNKYPGSGRLIYCICDKCGKIRKIAYNFYRKLCKSCSNKNRKFTKEYNPMYGKHWSNEAKIKSSCSHRNILINEFNGFTHKQKYCSLFNNRFKETIRNYYHRKCYLCNKNEKDNRRKLDVHHVNYDKNALCNHNGEFIPLCISCHIKTNSNRQMWEDLIMCYLYPERYFMINI